MLGCEDLHARVVSVGRCCAHEFMVNTYSMPSVLLAADTVKIEYAGSPIADFNGPIHTPGLHIVRCVSNWCYRECLIVSSPLGCVQQWLWYSFFLISSSHNRVEEVQCCLLYLTFQHLLPVIGQAYLSPGYIVGVMVMPVPGQAYLSPGYVVGVMDMPVLGQAYLSPGYVGGVMVMPVLGQA